MRISRPVTLAQVTAHCDRLLRPQEFKDYDGAANGLQVENRGTVSRIAAAVDASLATVRLAAEAGAASATSKQLSTSYWLTVYKKCRTSMC